MVFPWSAPSRATQMQNLKEKHFDVLVIGGGCVGNGIALDAATRGLGCAVVEREDFAAGTSGRSTKLIHGGVRYLEAAVKKLDKGQYDLVKEALGERAHMIGAAPYIARPIPIMIPLEHWWQVPMMWIGTKLYDFIAGDGLCVPPSMFIGRHQARYSFPTLNAQHIYGAIVYYDGQMNDTRYALLVALTAAQAGATTANHVNIDELVVDERTGRVSGALATDQITGENFHIRAKSVINATGPFTDKVRRMAFDAVNKAKGVDTVKGDSDEKWDRDIVVPAGGIHVMLPDHFSPAQMGLIVPETSDGRVLFFLPWEGGTLCGTTDSEAPISMHPSATKEEVDFVLAESSRYLNKKVRRSDVLAAWSGLRPLVKDPNKGDTKSISREHIVEVNDGNMVTIAGGKWTTYRQMAEDAIDKVLELYPSLSKVASSCQTKNMMLVGSDRAHIVCDQRFDNIMITLREDYGFDRDIAEHLTRNYGTRALQIAEIVKDGYVTRKPGLHPKRLVAKYPFLEAEVVFAVEQEYALTAEDVLARRTRLAFVDQKAAVEALPLVVDLMGRLLNWNSRTKKDQIQKGLEFLDTMNVNFDEEE
eukprot:CAMPEP_0204842816 /NCGR_PEP_ID=MMETSP1346-20131115/47614_1 /ASSEMBLY_ACC=CAM_ASM_000771 /TAXON_ID=215587 /ORGANISM="Aplanochytrium stocchinoi, Strain GSBS06" /LENGTH=588 /DNA_ID=CAMNT_0051981853 /DNA_START=262 /DNA_END=2028 /DNA_ORIENTATION=-